jgi:hypothetical protein
VLNYFVAHRHVEKQAGKRKRLTHEEIFRLHAIIAARYDAALDAAGREGDDLAPDPIAAKNETC